MKKNKHKRFDTGNPWRGEVVVKIDGKPYTAKLTMNALAQAEQKLNMSLMEMLQHLEKGTLPLGAMLTLVQLAVQAGSPPKKDFPSDENLEIDGGLLTLYQTLNDLFHRAFHGGLQGLKQDT